MLADKTLFVGAEKAGTQHESHSESSRVEARNEAVNRSEGKRKEKSEVVKEKKHVAAKVLI